MENQKDKKPKSRRRMQIGISFMAVAIALVIIFIPKKMENHTSDSNTPKFIKQGELTLTNSKGNPIVSIDIEIADNEAKREVGMMGRTEMEERQGMLFVFEEEFIASFWMRNTILSLDMIFANKQGKIVTIHKNTKPFSDDNYSATGLTLYVLEVNAGFTDKYGIKEGDMITWKRN
jgi:uncharacterized protein